MAPKKEMKMFAKNVVVVAVLKGDMEGITASFGAAGLPEGFHRAAAACAGSLFQSRA
jgi:hypothetical protein